VVKNNILPLENKILTFAPLCDILFISTYIAAFKQKSYEIHGQKREKNIDIVSNITWPSWPKKSIYENTNNIIILSVLSVLSWCKSRFSRKIL